MTSLRPQRSTERKALGAGWGVVDLRKRPAPIVPPSGGGRDTIPSFIEITPWSLQMLSVSGFASGILHNFSWTVDAAIPTGGYMQGNAVGDYMQFGMPLGPYGSLWAVAVGTYLNTDGGRVQVEWATTKVKESDAAAGTVSSISTPSWEGATFYRVTNSDGSDKFTCYSGAAGFHWYDARSTFGIAGADGTVLGANATMNVASSPWSANFFNASGFIKFFATGGGDPTTYWWCRLRIESAGAGAGTKARIGWIRVYRVSGGDAFIT